METYLRFSIEETEISQNLMSTNMLYCTFVKLANHIINHSCPILNSTQYSINFCPTKKYIIHKCCATKKKKKLYFVCIKISMLFRILIKKTYLAIVLLPLYDEAIPTSYLTHTSPQLFLSPFLLVWNEPKVSTFVCMNGNLSIHILEFLLY